MEINNDIRGLLAQKIAGSLSAGEEEQIDLLIATDPAVKDAWEELKKMYERPEEAKELDGFDTSVFLEEIKTKMARQDIPEPVLPDEVISMIGNEHQKSFRIINLLLVAVTLTGLGIFIYMVTRPANTQKVLTAQHNIPARSIYLELADGNIVNLTENERVRDIKAGQVLLHNYHDTLTFSAPVTATGINRLVVPAGKEYTIQLSDGSIIHMNASSSILFSFSFPRIKREITFAGEAYMSVAASPDQPFVVHTSNGASIQVLGTAFNINSYDSGKVTVSLVQGSIQMKAGKQEVILRPGFQAAYTIENNISTRTFNKNDVLSWLDGKYVFHNVPFRQIKPILERLYDVRIVIDNPAVAEKPFSAEIFKADGISAFLDMMKTTGDADNYTKDDTIHIK